MTMTLKEALRVARPNLKTYSPLTFWIMLVMGLFNVIIGFTLYVAFDHNRLAAPLLIVNEYTSYQFWGIVFLALGGIKLYSLYKNDWDLARRSLLIGVAIKAMWAVALLIRAATSPGTMLVALLWITLATIQMGTYVWFMPPSIASYKQRKDDR